LAYKTAADISQSAVRLSRTIRRVGHWNIGDAPVNNAPLACKEEPRPASPTLQKDVASNAGASTVSSQGNRRSGFFFGRFGGDGGVGGSGGSNSSQSIGGTIPQVTIAAAQHGSQPEAMGNCNRKMRVAVRSV